MMLKECNQAGEKFVRKNLGFGRNIPNWYEPTKGATFELTDLILTVSMDKCPVPKRFRVGSATGTVKIDSRIGKLYFEIVIEAKNIADVYRCYDMMLDNLGSVTVRANAIEELAIAAGHLVSETVAVVTDTIAGAISGVFDFIGINQPEAQTV